MIAIADKQKFVEHRRKGWFSNTSFTTGLKTLPTFRPSQDLQRTDAQGGNPHQAEPPLPQQGWWAGAAWMLDGRLEEGNPATSSDTP